ncbi:MAG: SH3 domain-containing protein [Reinekea sp.]
MTSPSNETDASSGRILMAVSASILNVRGQPSVNGDVLMKLGEGAQVWAYPDEAEGLWMLVQVDGAIGYVSARFLTEVP